jgi:hypothetical protein
MRGKVIEMATFQVLILLGLGSLGVQAGPHLSERIEETASAVRRLRAAGRRLFTCDQALPSIQNELGSGSSVCQCADLDSSTNSSFVNCANFCQLCRDDLDLCVSYDFGFNFVEGEITTYTSQLTYSGSRTDVLTFQENYDGEILQTCETGVNDVPCNSCGPSPGSCEEDSVIYDCTNIEEGALFDDCAGGFEGIPATSVFAAYNTDFFDDGDCLLSPTVSAFPTESPMTITTTASPSLPPILSLTLEPFQIGVEFFTLDEAEFVATLLDFLNEGLVSFFPEYVGVVLNSQEPDDGLPLGEAIFLFEGEANFLGIAPSQTELLAAQQVGLNNIAALQESIDENALVGTDVFVVVVVISPLSESPTMSPVGPFTKGKGKGKGKGARPWSFQQPKTMKKKKGKMYKGKQKKMKGKKKKGKKTSWGEGGNYASPTYPGAMKRSWSVTTGKMNGGESRMKRSYGKMAYSMASMPPKKWSAMGRMRKYKMGGKMGGKMYGKMGEKMTSSYTFGGSVTP